jgi:sugar phosphate permease
MNLPVCTAVGRTRWVNRASRRRIRIRWWIFAYMFAFAMLSYIQRTSVQDAAEKIMPALHLSQFQIGLLAAAFTVAYTLAQLPGGIFGQRFGARYTYVLVGIVGLVATLAFPIASMTFGATTLFVVLLTGQALLGISQGPVFPVFAAVVESWFPVNRWAIANGLQTA